MPRLARLVAALTVFAAGSAALAADVRTWTDTTGKFRVTAAFVALKAGKVTLEKPDGSKVEIPLAKLSAADRSYAIKASMSGPKPAPKGEDDPFQPKPAGGAAEPADAGAGAGEAKMLTPDLANVRQVGLGTAPDGWAVAVDAPAAAPELSLDPVALPAKASFFEKVKGLAVGGKSPRAVVGYVDDFTKKAPPGGGEPVGTTRLVLCDLAAGKRLGVATVPGPFAPLAVHDDGQRVLVRKDVFGFGNSDKLEVWGLAAGGGVTRQVAWEPHADLQGPDRDVKWAAFVSDTRALTVSGSGRVTAWEFATATPVYQFQTHSGSVPALTPDRKYLAFSTDKEIGLLDVEAGKVVAAQAAPAGAWPAMAVSPTGARLARLSFDKVEVWDAATGKLVKEVSLAGFPVQGPVVMPTDGHVLVGNQTLIDIDTQVRVWGYEGAEAVEPVGAVCYFVASDGDKKPGALVAARVPPAAAKAALAKALADPDFFVLKPGVTVKLNVSRLADLDARDQAEDALTAKLKAHGIEVGPDGVIELVATTEVGKEKEVSFRSFGAFREKTYKYTEHFSRVKFVYEGKTAWESVAGNSPGFFVRLEEGETMEQHLKKLEKPNYKFFGAVQLPKLLTRPSDKPTLGSSRVTAAGVR